MKVMFYGTVPTFQVAGVNLDSKPGRHGNH